MKKKTKDFAAVIRSKIEANPALKDAVENEAFNSNIARQIYEARTAAKLTQTGLANRVGTQQGVISRLEDADYGSHSLTMLRKIAKALDCRLRVEFYPRCKPPDSLHATLKAEAEYPSQSTANIAFSVSMTAQAMFSTGVSSPQVS